ncbi:MAG: hypothetical protein MUO72_09965 [Bacteroidales bacterium]|nr:hypothetical protein [Bacteroidales bacterium]
MKIIINRIVLFILFFGLFSVIVNSIFLATIALTDWDFVKRLQSLKFENPDFELLVLGASQSEYAFDTELLTYSGIKSFNLSLVGSSVRTGYIQLNEYLTKYPSKPRFVILGVNSYLEDFHGEGIQPVVEFTMKDHKYGIKDIPVTKFNWAGMELLKKAVLSEYRKTTVTFGHKKSLRTIPDNSGYKSTSLDFAKFESAYWINRLAELCAQNGIGFIIIDLPGVRETQNVSGIGPYTIHYSDGSQASLYNLNSQDFCKYIDYNKDWAGLSHFNKYGAERFTKEFFKIVFDKQGY